MLPLSFPGKACYLLIASVENIKKSRLQDRSGFYCPKTSAVPTLALPRSGSRVRTGKSSISAGYPQLPSYLCDWLYYITWYRFVKLHTTTQKKPSSCVLYYSGVKQLLLLSLCSESFPAMPRGRFNRLPSFHSALRFATRTIKPSPWRRLPQWCSFWPE